MDEPARRHSGIDYGLGVFRQAAFAIDRPEDEVFDLAAVYQRLVTNDDLAGFEVSGRFYEIGSAAGLEETREVGGGSLEHNISSNLVVSLQYAELSDATAVTPLRSPTRAS